MQQVSLLHMQRPLHGRQRGQHHGLRVIHLLQNGLQNYQQINLRRRRGTHHGQQYSILINQLVLHILHHGQLHGQLAIQRLNQRRQHGLLVNQLQLRG